MTQRRMGRKGVVPELPGLSRSSPLMRTVQRRRRSRLVRWLRLLLPLVPGGPAWHRLLWAFGGLLLTLGFGVLGYHLIDDFAPFDALYQTALTITTVGFQEVHSAQPRGAVVYDLPVAVRRRDGAVPLGGGGGAAVGGRSLP